MHEISPDLSFKLQTQRHAKEASWIIQGGPIVNRFNNVIWAKQADGTPAVEMSRYQCDSCHVPQVDAKPLVDNAFVGVTKK